MFSSEVKELLVQVITSWQVIAVTVALVLYVRIVSYVAKEYHKPRTSLKSKIRRRRAQKAPPGPEEVVTAPGASVNDQLGLEEA